jgi:hypothetical protein
MLDEVGMSYEPHNPLNPPYPKGRQLKTGKNKTHPRRLFMLTILTNPGWL